MEADWVWARVMDGWISLAVDAKHLFVCLFVCWFGTWVASKQESKQACLSSRALINEFTD